MSKPPPSDDVGTTVRKILKEMRKQNRGDEQNVIIKCFKGEAVEQNSCIDLAVSISTLSQASLFPPDEEKPDPFGKHEIPYINRVITVFTKFGDPIKTVVKSEYFYERYYELVLQEYENAEFDYFRLKSDGVWWKEQTTRKN